MRRHVAISALVIVLVLALIGCVDSPSSQSTESGSGLNPAQIEPAAPADKAADTVDDANATTDDRSSEIYELTDSE